MSSRQRPGYWEAFAEVAAASSCLGDFAQHVLELRSLQSPWMDQRRGLQEWVTELPGHVGLSRESCSPCHGQRVREARTAIGVIDFMAAPRHEKAGAKHPRSCGLAVDPYCRTSATLLARWHGNAVGKTFVIYSCAFM